MVKNKLVLMPEDEHRKNIKINIIKFIEKGWIRDKERGLSDIQAVFQKPPHSLSDGTIRNILDELIKERKLSTWKNGKNRYYGLPTLPVSLKFGGAFAIMLIFIVVFIDILFDSEYMFSQLFPGFFSLTVYSLILITIFTAFSYVRERKLYK